jgi:SAM-dependent methyltransferase
MPTALPLSLRLRTRQAVYLPLELRDSLVGRHNPLLPPRWLRYVGGGDFTEVGTRLARHCRGLARLRPDEDVLDVGCGVGRLAVPLTGYLCAGGGYRGFDVVRPFVRWCRRAITPRFPHFQFEHADVHNRAYNPRGRWRARDVVFPHGHAAFDLVVLSSVFTHMLPTDVAHYLQEVRRVLRPGGRCLASFFLLNAESRERITGSGSWFHFNHDAGGCYTARKDRPEAAVAYADNDVRGLFRQAGLEVQEPIHYGGWSGREGALEGQDLVLASRGLSH